MFCSEMTVFAVGNCLAKPNAQHKHITPRIAIEKRHDKNSVSTPIPTRPIIPPKAVPAIYKPITFVKFFGWISSATHAMATAGTPPKTKPSILLAITKTCQFGDIAQIIFSMDANNSEPNINRFLLPSA